MDNIDNEMLEACKICKKINSGDVEYGCGELEWWQAKYGIYDCGGSDNSTCLGKDRAIIVLLDKLLKNWNNDINHSPDTP